MGNTFHLEAREAAVEAAWSAAGLIRMHAGQLAAEDIEEKGVHDLVTRMDNEVQALLIRQLTRAFPGVNVLAEEGADLSGVSAVADSARWIIDPIDGTTNFTHGLAPYAVSIGLQEGADIVVGVVLEVAHGELFTAVRGGGAFRNGVRIRVSRTEALNDSLLTTGFPYRSFGHIDAYLDVLRRFMREARGVRRPGSASVDLANVACGRFDGFFETGLQPWDVAAGIVLVEEAGGRVTDYQGEPGALFGQQVLASNGLVHHTMLDVLEPMQAVTR